MCSMACRQAMTACQLAEVAVPEGEVPQVVAKVLVALVE